MGFLYILHPVHLAEQMTDETTTCIALLHDVLEDTALTLPDLEAEFPREITEAVQLLTHAPSDDYLDYVRRLCENPLARKVKIADLAHNSDETRLSSVTPDPMQLKHWRTKYAAKRLYENMRKYPKWKLTHSYKLQSPIFSKFFPASPCIDYYDAVIQASTQCDGNLAAILL